MDFNAAAILKKDVQLFYIKFIKINGMGITERVIMAIDYQRSVEEAQRYF